MLFICEHFRAIGCFVTHISCFFFVKVKKKNRFRKKSGTGLIPVSICIDYTASFSSTAPLLMAPFGQTAAHSPQSTHLV